MRKFILLSFVILLFITSAKARASESSSNNIHFGKILQKEGNFTVFIKEHFKTVQFESRKEVTEVIEQQNLKTVPVLSEFIYQLSHQPEAFAKFLRIFFNTKAFVYFSLGFILTLILSHYLGEFKFKFRALSFWRITYSLFRFALVNGLRVWLFLLFFSENIKPVSKIYMVSVYNVSDYHPILYKVSSLLSVLM